MSKLSRLMKLKNTLTALKGLSFLNPTNKDDAVEMIRNSYKRGYLPKETLCKLMIDNYRKDTMKLIKKANKKGVPVTLDELIKQFNEDKAVYDMVTNDLEMDAGIFHEIARQLLEGK